MGMDPISKFANEIIASSIDPNAATQDKAFAQAMIIAQPVAPLEEKGVIEVMETEADQAVFTVMVEHTPTWRTIDTRGAEAASNGSYSAFGTPTYATATILTRSATYFIHDSVSLVNPVTFESIAKSIGNQIKKKKILDAITTLTTEASYTEATSVYNAGGFIAATSVTSAHVIAPNDFVLSKKDMKSKTTPVVPDVALLHSSQLNSMENSANFSPGQTTNSNYKKAKFDEFGHLIEFDGMEIIELLEAEAAQQSSSPFGSSTKGHWAVIGRRDLMLGRGENNKKNTVEDFRDPKTHGTQRTVNVNYGYVLKYPDGIRLLRCYDA